MGFFSVLGNFLEIQMDNPSIILLFLFVFYFFPLHPPFSPCSAFLIAALLPNICEFGKVFLLSVTLEAVSGSLNICTAFRSVVCELVWEPGAL